ncbi:MULTISPECIES: TetR/AcrR family transcriptional regulator [unclassified Romboutsia]|uniref:TetR/AcrR family transcriptional regulator n=1 Tax=unclassified Romboutsia TaxID=2626894 RepID=UPI000822B3F8|nr:MULTISPECIES: TetR/AcrR family transcriptional regulator [unclassified Romboutsia]SCH45818.1 Fatty acid metabolism regulator protein [uncultured Clostridium sp.]
MTKNSTKENLIKAMYKLIAEEGYEKASINKICTLAGVKKPTFYHYFNSKEEVFINIIKETYPSNFGIILDEIKSITSIEDYKKALYEYGDKFIESYEEDIDIRKICAEIDLQTTRIDEAKKIVDECENIIADNLYKIALHGREIGAFSKEADLKTFSQNIHNMIIGLDKSFICNIKIDARKIWRFNIDAMFALCKEIR